MKRKTAKLWAALLTAVLILNCGISPVAVGATTLTDAASVEEESAAEDSETEETSAAVDSGSEEGSSTDDSKTEETSAADNSEAEEMSSTDADEAENSTEEAPEDDISSEADTDANSSEEVITEPNSQSDEAKDTTAMVSSVSLTANSVTSTEGDASETAEVLVIIDGCSMAMTWENYNDSNYDVSDFTATTTLSGTLDMDIIFVGDNEENPVTINGSLDLGEHKIYSTDGAGIYIIGDDTSDTSAAVYCGGIEAPNAYLEMYVSLVSSGDVSVSFMDFRGSVLDVDGSLYGNTDSTAVDEGGASGYMGFWSDEINITGDISTDDGMHLYFRGVNATIGGSVSGYCVMFYSSANIAIGGSVSLNSYCNTSGNTTVVIEGDVSAESLSSNYGSNVTVKGNADIVDNIFAENYIEEDGSYEVTTLTIYGNASVTETKELTDDSEYWGAITAFEGTQITIGGDAYAEEGFDIYKDATLSIDGNVTTAYLWTDEYGTLIIGGDLTFDEFYTTEYAVIEIGGDLTVSDANEDGWGIANNVTLTVDGNLTSPNLDVWDSTAVQVGGNVTVEDYIHVGNAGTLTIGGDVTACNIGTFSIVKDDEGNETDELITGSCLTINGSLTVTSTGIHVETGTGITVDGNVTVAPDNIYASGSDASLVIGGDVTVESGAIDLSDGAVASIGGDVTVGYAIFVSDGSLLAIGESSLTEDTDGGTVSISGQTVTTPDLNCYQLHLSDAILNSDVRVAQIYVYSDSVVNGAWEIEGEYLTDTSFCYKGGILCNMTSFNGAACVENSDATWYFYSIDELADVLGIEIEASTTYTLSCDDPTINDVEIVIDENGSAACTTYLLPENITLVSAVSNADTDTDPDSSGSGDNTTGGTGSDVSGDDTTGDTGSDSDTTNSMGSGSSSQEDTDADSFYETIRSIEAEIAAASASAVSSGAETAVVTIDSAKTGIVALPNSIMQCLVKYSNVTLVHNFTYNGADYSIVIPAGTAVDDDTEWYGPLWLYEHYGSYSLDATSGQAATAVQDVQTGDTAGNTVMICLSIMAAAALCAGVLVFRKRDDLFR